MAISITPGYDFGTDELPTRELFLRQARDLKITNIPISNIDAAIISLVFGNVSNTSGATTPGLGWIWVDPQGNRFLGCQNRTVRSWQAQGGWETGRFYVQPDGSGQNSTDEGEPVAVKTTPAGFEHRLTSMNTDDLPALYLAQPMESGYTRARLLFRGGGQVFIGGQASAANFYSMLVGMHSTTSSDLVVAELDAGTRKGHVAFVYDRGNSGAATPVSFAWFPGVICRGQGSL